MEEDPWAGYLDEEEGDEGGFATTVDCMEAMMWDEGFLDEDRWMVVEVGY